MKITDEMLRAGVRELFRGEHGESEEERVARSFKAMSAAQVDDADTIRRGGAILSTLQGCEDPLGQQGYYEDIVSDLLRQLRAAP